MKMGIVVGIVLLILLVGGVFLLMNRGGQRELVDYEHQASLESDEPKTEVRANGFNAEVLVEPSVGNVISGVVTVRVTKAPEGTKIALFAMSKQGADVKTTGPNLGVDSDGSDGWSRIVDTTRFENGIYDISGIAGVDGNSDPLGVATAQVIVEN